LVKYSRRKVCSFGVSLANFFCSGAATLTVLAVLAAGVDEAAADTVYLKNGKTLEGEVIKEDDQVVIVRVTDGSEGGGRTKDYVIGTGQAGEITKKIRARYLDVVHGKVKTFAKWLTYVND
jgi:hypothetical protein